MIQQIKIPTKLLRLISPKRFKVIIGGRGGAKSESVAALFSGMVDQSGCTAVCCREFQSSIKQSVHSLMTRKIMELGLDGYDCRETNIRHRNGGIIGYQGLARDPQAIKSIDDAELCWVEEAQTLSERSLEELTPSIRGKAAEIWFTANLDSSNDPFALRFFKPYERELRRDGYYEDELHTIVWINYSDNPWFPEHLEAERVLDKERLSVASYEHKWLGEPSDTIPNSFILPEWFDAAIDAHIKLGFDPKGARVVSHDPSDLGPDPKGLCLRHGSVILDVQENDHDDINDGCDWATDYAINNDADLFIWDCDGMGAGLKRQVADAFDGKKIDNFMFKGSESVDRPKETYQPIEGENPNNARSNEDTFKNKRSQYAGMLRDRYHNAYRAVVKGNYVDPDSMISLSSKIKCLDLLRSETCRIPEKHNGNGKFQVMPKPEMFSKFGIKSPNLFDSTMMSLMVARKKKVIDVKPIPRLKRF